MFWHLIDRKYPNIIIAESTEDILKARQENKAALLLVTQCGDFIGNKLHRIEAFYRLGLRVMIPAYNATNLLCDGCLDQTDNGLTRFGSLVVEECNRIGMLLDCSHIGRRASLDIIERSEQPVIFSHSNVKSLVESPRNIDDEQIKTCVAAGGIICLTSWAPLLLEAGKTERPTVDDLIDHVDYIAQLTGSTGHIGLGTDMSLGTYPDHWHDPWGEPDYIPFTKVYDTHITSNVRSPRRAAEGFSNYPEVINFIDKLMGKGFSSEDVGKILGENCLRLFESVWK
jgi:membrane dipeptidase